MNAKEYNPAHGGYAGEVETNGIKRIIDNKNSMCLVEYKDGNTGYCHVDRTSEIQRKKFVAMKEAELQKYLTQCGMSQ